MSKFILQPNIEMLKNAYGIKGYKAIIKLNDGSIKKGGLFSYFQPALNKIVLEESDNICQIDNKDIDTIKIGGVVVLDNRESGK